MKNLILDTPIRHSFPDFLGKGETIIWEGKPCFNNTVFNEAQERTDDFSTHRSIVFSLFLIGLSFYSFYNEDYIMGGFYIIGIFFTLNFFSLLNRKLHSHYRYAITQKQILFRLKEKWWHKNPVFHSIPLSDIRDIIIIMEYDIDRMREETEAADMEFNEHYYIDKGLDKIGSIILVPHHPHLIPFETRDLNNNNKRHQPSMELLENVEEVAEMIREGIRTNVK